MSSPLSGIPCKYITPLEGLEELAGGSYVKYSPGCNGTACEGHDLVADAVSVSREADAVIIFAGLSLIQEREKLDRTSLLLPGYQQQLIQAIADVADAKPVVLVIISGGPVDLNFAKEDERIQSILWVGYPGEAGGQAIAEVIFGDHNPGKRLYSYRHSFQLWDIPNWFECMWDHVGI
jgi:beta-D-xylosidase 4